MTESARDPSDGRITMRREGHLFLIGIDRPKKLNGFSGVMLDELGRAFSAFEREPEARCAVLYAEGPHFTAGLQLDQVGNRFAEGRPLFPQGEVDPVNLRAPLRTKPVVAAVQGICFTLGIELMLAADMVIAASDCRFAQLEVKRGIMANQGATIRMTERAGLGNALRYLLTGDEFDAQTALRLGFVQEVVTPGAQLARAVELARSIAAQGPLAVQASLANARRSVFEGLEAAVAELETAQARLMASEDAREGVQSFIERRAAVFTGR